MNEIVKWKIRQDLRSRVKAGRAPSLVLDVAKVILEDEIVRFAAKRDRMTEELKYIQKLTPAILEEDLEDMPPRDYIPRK